MQSNVPKSGSCGGGTSTHVFRIPDQGYLKGLPCLLKPNKSGWVLQPEDQSPGCGPRPESFVFWRHLVVIYYHYSKKAEPAHALWRTRVLPWCFGKKWKWWVESRHRLLATLGVSHTPLSMIPDCVPSTRPLQSSYSSRNSCEKPSKAGSDVVAHTFSLCA